MTVSPFCGTAKSSLPVRSPNSLPPNLSEAIAGRTIQIERLQPPSPDRSARPVLEVEELRREPDYRGITFRLWPCEILGLTGLLGCGRAELALSLAGKTQRNQA